MINLNRETTFEGIVKHKIVFFNLFELSASTKENKFNQLQLGRALKNYIENIGCNDYDKERLIELFSLNNLEKQNIIVLNNDSDSFTFNNLFYDLFSYLNEDKYYKLNNHSLKKFTNSIKSFKEDLDKIDFNNKYNAKQFIDLLMQEFEEIRQALDKHVRILDSKVNNLISILENQNKNENEYLSSYQLSQEIYDLNFYFIDPLREFLSSDSSIDLRKKGLGISTYVKKIKKKLHDEGYYKEETEITAFLLNFLKSYLSKAETMSTLLSRYVLKSVDDLKIHSNIEKLFLFLEEKMNEISHGKKANKYLKSTDLLEKIDFLPYLKKKEVFSTIDYESELEIFDIQWENINSEINDLKGIKKNIKTFEKTYTEEDLNHLKEEEFITRGNGIISECKKDILNSKIDHDADIILLCHNKLKHKMPEYKLFYSLLLVYSLEENFNFKTDFNEKLFINYNGEKLIYTKKIIGDLKNE